MRRGDVTNRKSEDYPELEDLWPLTEGEMWLADKDRAREAKWQAHLAERRAETDRFARVVEGETSGIDFEMMVLNILLCIGVGLCLWKAVTVIGVM